ncbi:MAG: ring-hydroxylating oxygenase subunit alpha [Ilumatobacteraceae bacterium]|nr:ring-hydroxylating oxygenase subunit alpha [Ilumatobacteraceae bacterium]
MLSAADNELLTRTGPGTGMGELFRRFWQPVLLSRELPEPDCPPVRVTVLGEPLVAFRDTRGRVGLVEPNCPHRGANLFFGRNEECGIRCAYHGWKFDVDGNCLEIPTMSREEGMRSRIHLHAYPTQEWGDLVWAYMGPPEHQPALPEMDFAVVTPSHRFVTKKLQECNWAQACEGALDTSHFSFLHTPLIVPEVPASRRSHPMADATRWMKDDSKPVFNVVEHEVGLLLAASRHADDEDLYWRVTQFLMPNHSLAPGSAPGDIYFGQTWVPIDDRSCWVYVYSWNPERPLTDREDHFIPGTPTVHAEVDEHWAPIRNRGNDYLIDRVAQRTVSFTGIQGISEQDAAIQDSQGLIVDRTREHLGPTDLGIVRFRRMILDAACALRDGVEPRAAAAPSAYRVRGGAAVAPAAEPAAEVLVARFGNETGRVVEPSA